jgi:hypothetical protein
MKSTMRVPILLVCSALVIDRVHADPLSAADREALLDSLAKIREAADSNIEAKYRVALTAYRNASESDEAAMELYLNCIERVNFEDTQKKSSDFREWKRKESDNLSNPGMKVALRLQLRWLILTLQSLSDKADRAKLSLEAQQIVDGIFGSPEKLRGQQDLLGQSVLSTVFARAYEITHVKVKEWPTSPTQLDSVYEDLIMPPLRSPSRVADLRTAWIKRIRQEEAKVEYFGGGRPAERKNGSSAAATTLAQDKFLEETQPKMQWEMELDLFRNGDEAGAATRMLAHLQKNISHPSAKDWSDQFKNLLAPQVQATP